jgi:hypothetical protein
MEVRDHCPVKLPVMPPIRPMLAKLAREMPAEGTQIYEPGLKQRGDA